MSLPMMLSMLVQALYNIVDSMFVAKLSEDALTAVSLAFPIQTLMIAVASEPALVQRHFCPVILVKKIIKVPIVLQKMVFSLLF